MVVKCYFFQLWFAEKFVSLLIEQHHQRKRHQSRRVVICWKIRIFAYWTTPAWIKGTKIFLLWFAEKFVSLLIEQHHQRKRHQSRRVVICWKIRIFAYWTTPAWIKGTKIFLLWFAEKFVSLLIEQHRITPATFTPACCDLLKNSYLCLLNNTGCKHHHINCVVVICWKIRIFAYWTTPRLLAYRVRQLLWFAEKFVSLLIEQHLPFHSD